MCLFRDVCATRCDTPACELAHTGEQITFGVLSRMVDALVAKVGPHNPHHHTLPPARPPKPERDFVVVAPPTCALFNPRHATCCSLLPALAPTPVLASTPPLTLTLTLTKP